MEPISLEYARLEKKSVVSIIVLLPHSILRVSNIMAKKHPPSVGMCITSTASQKETEYFWSNACFMYLFILDPS